jgi:hypothetical protein
VKLFVL